MYLWELHGQAIQDTEYAKQTGADLLAATTTINDKSLPQCNDFVGEGGQLLVSVKKKTLVMNKQGMSY